MSNKFLNYSTGDINLTNGTANIYANVLGADSLTPSMPIKTNSTNNLISTKLDIADINNLQNTLNSVLTNPYLGDLVSNAFIKNGGTNQQYLMADGSTLEASANSGNSNIYLYNNISNVMTPPLDIGDIGYNNINQGNATIIYISHLTRDGLDIERYYNDLTDLNYVYIQDQSNSTNFIKYIITGTPTVIINEYISIPVIVEDSGGTGATTFGNNHDIILSFFSNLIEIDQRITSLESKVQNQTAIAGTSTTFTGTDGIISSKFIKSGATSSDILLGDGSTANISRITTLETKVQNITATSTNTTLSNDLTLDNTTIKGTINFENQLIKVGVYNVGTLNNITNNVVLGNNAGTTSITCENNILIGQNVGSSLVNGDDNIGIGDGTIFFANGNKNIHIGSFAGITSTGDNNICIGYGANADTFSTGNDNIYIGKACRTSNTTITNSINIGSDIIATNSNEIIIGNSANDNLKMGNSNGFFTGNFKTDIIYPNSLICNLGSIDAPFKNIYYSGQLIGTTNPILNITNSATLFYNNITLISSNSSFIPATALTAVGNAATQVAQDTTTAKGKLFKSFFGTTSPASFQDHGLLGTSSFLLNGQGLYIGMGFNIKISFGVADAGSAVVNSSAGMFVGLVSATTITWSASVLPSNLTNCIGIGHNPAGATINTYSRGSVGGDGPFTQWNTSTPDNRWFHLSLTNQFNSNIVLLSLTETISGITESYSFICGQGTLTPAMNVRMYPCIQRFHNGSGGVSQAAQVHFGQLTYNQLI